MPKLAGHWREKKRCGANRRQEQQPLCARQRGWRCNLKHLRRNPPCEQGLCNEQPQHQQAQPFKGDERHMAVATADERCQHQQQKSCSKRKGARKPLLISLHEPLVSCRSNFDWRAHRHRRRYKPHQNRLPQPTSGARGKKYLWLNTLTGTVASLLARYLWTARVNISGPVL